MFIFILLIILASSFIVLDAFLKAEEVEEEGFSFKNVYWVVLLPMFFIMGIIFIQCFYYKFVRGFLSS